MQLTNRAKTLFIGGVDYSSQLNGGTLDVAFLEEAGGLCACSGSLNLSEGAQPINEDLQLGLFEEGTLINLSIDDGLGNQRPWGHQLRCIKPAYSKGKQVLRVGDVFALGDRTPATSFLTAQAVPGLALSSRTLIERWAKAGFDLEQFDWQSSRQFYFGWPPEVKGSSYREAISALLSSLGLKAWVNQSGTMVIKDVEPAAGAALFSLSAEQDLRLFEPVEMGDRPAEKLHVNGTYNQIGKRDPEIETITTSEYANGTVSGRNTHRDRFNFATAQQTITDIEELDGDLLYAVLIEAGKPAPSTSLTKVREAVQISTFQGSSSGKLTKIKTETDERRIKNMAGYLGWQLSEEPDEVSGSFWNDLIPNAKVEEVLFYYDNRERITKRVETHEETVGAILSALGSFDWSLYNNSLTARRTSYARTESWTYEGTEVRAYQLHEEIPAARDQNSRTAINTLLDGETPQNGINLALTLLDVSDRQSGRDGNLNAPATQRKPASRYFREETPLERTYDFPKFASPWADNERSITMAYLPDEGSIGGLAVGTQVISPEAAMAHFGRIAGHLYKSSTKARKIEGPLFAQLLAQYEPWPVVDITEGPVTRRMALDGLRLQWDNSKMLLESAAPCLGTVLGNGALVLPYA